MTLSTLLVADRKVRCTVQRVLEELSEMKKKGEQNLGYYYPQGYTEGEGGQSQAISDLPAATGKRRCSQEGHGSRGEDGNKDETPDSAATQPDREAKKPRLSRATTNLSCPFRRRNPLRFNVRDYPRCTLGPFSNITLLK